jgi:hypothetical protein
MLEIDEQVGVLTNYWWAVTANDYSISIALVITGILTVAKILAVIHPSNKSNDIVCLLQGYFYGFPGMKKEDEKK